MAQLTLGHLIQIHPTSLKPPLLNFFLLKFQAIFNKQSNLGFLTKEGNFPLGLDMYKF